MVLDDAYVDRYLVQLTGDAFKALVLLARLKGEREAGHADNLADMLNLTPERTVEALRLLERHGLLQIERNVRTLVYDLPSTPEARQTAKEAFRQRSTGAYSRPGRRRIA